MPSLVRRAADEEAPADEPSDGRTFDVFISHASEDKDDVVRPLANALRAAGLDVWYDEFELRIGDSLRRKIDRGLAGSRFGVVVLSQAFFGRGWPEYELDGLVTRAINGEQILLPIWHNVSKQEVMGYSSSLADKLARSTATHTVEEIASEIVDVIRNPPESR
jgi:TIR domain-containing protein